MKSKRIVIILLALIILTPNFVLAVDNKASPGSNIPILKNTLNGLNLQNPEKDIYINSKKGDFKFICFCGEACYAPGVKGKDTSFTDKYGMSCLPGTSDVIENELHGELIKKHSIMLKAIISLC